MEKKKLLIALLLSTFGGYACAQFCKELTIEEKKQSEKHYSKIQNKKQKIVASFDIKKEYQDEIISIIDYYEAKKYIFKYNTIKEKQSDNEKAFYKEYYNELYQILFLNGYYKTTPNYQLAFSLRNELKLSKTALRKLALKAIDMNMNIQPQNEQECWNIEFKELTKILTNEQMDVLLSRKNIHKIWHNVDKAWNLLCKYPENIVTQDSLNIKLYLYNYFRKKTIADELYWNNPELHNEVHQTIKRFSPSIVQKVELLQKKNRKKDRSSIKDFLKTTPYKENYIWSTSFNRFEDNKYQIKKAIKLAIGADGRLERDTAFSTLSTYANKNATAMNALGLMYLKGYGTSPDTLLALNWLTKAGESGCYDAYNNLGVFYKLESRYMNHEKAFKHFSRAAEKGNPIGSYHTGYMLYKGIGCDQNYELAINHFKTCANINYAPGLYMLGLCYRNGYGVEMNESTGRKFLELSAAQSYKLALKELEMPCSENSILTTRKCNMGKTYTDSQYQPFNNIAFKVSDIKNGKYTGYLMTYDWSGKHIIDKTFLELSICNNGNFITGEWREENKEPIKIYGHIENSKLIFDNQVRRKVGRYKSMTHFSIFQEADLKIIEEEGSISISGILQMYSAQTKEKERPMYLTVKNIKEDSDSQRIVIYPNLYSKELNVYINVQRPTNIHIIIYNIQGIPVYKYNVGKLYEGEQFIAIQPNITKGTYIAKIFTDSEFYQQTTMFNL